METGGYDAKFIENPSDCFKCVICRFVLRDPVLFIDCGHRVCKICFEGIKKNAPPESTHVSCPMDRLEIDLSKVYEDKGIARAVLDFKVACNNSSGGCQWIGELRHLQTHLDSSCENTIPRQLMRRIDQCEAEMKKKDEEIRRLTLSIMTMYKHSMNVDEYIPNLRTIYIWKLDITTYDQPIFSPRFYSKPKGHYCMLRVSFISVPNKSGKNCVRFGIFFHIVKGVFGELIKEPFDMKINIEVRNKHGKMDTFEFTKDDVVQIADSAPNPRPAGEAAIAAAKPKSEKSKDAGNQGQESSTSNGNPSETTSDGETSVENGDSSNTEQIEMMPDVSKFVINDSLTIKCTLLHNQS